MFSSAVTNQALLSASNLLVGLALIRNAADEQYGFYVLVFNCVLLLTYVQSSFIHPSLALRLATASQAEAADLVGGLYHAQRRLLWPLTLLALALLLGAWLLGLVQAQLALLLLAGILAVCMSLYREFFRTVYFVKRLPHELVRIDALFVAGQLLGVAFATRTAQPAVVALLCTAAAAFATAQLLSRALARRGGIHPEASPEVWREVATLGGWSTAGAASHWMFSQGYNYVVAAMLDVASVSALAGTRLLLMPINLLSIGVGPLMMPFAAEWLKSHGARSVLRRVTIIAIALTLLSGTYLLFLWLAREWIFERVLHKHYAQADTLLAIWSVSFLVSAFRDQLRTFPAIFGKFRLFFVMTLVTAVCSLLLCFLGLRVVGVAGAPLSVLAGELFNFALIVALSFQLVREHDRPVAATA